MLKQKLSTYPLKRKELNKSLKLRNTACQIQIRYTKMGRKVSGLSSCLYKVVKIVVFQVWKNWSTTHKVCYDGRVLDSLLYLRGKTTIKTVNRQEITNTEKGKERSMCRKGHGHCFFFGDAKGNLLVNYLEKGRTIYPEFDDILLDQLKQKNQGGDQVQQRRKYCFVKTTLLATKLSG